MSVLSVRGISKSYGGVHAVDGVSFELDRGQITALIGPNGAGKSTCFNLLNGQIRPDSGDVVFDGRSIVGSRPRQIWKLGVGRTFQVPETYGSMTVRQSRTNHRAAPAATCSTHLHTSEGWLIGCLRSDFLDGGSTSLRNPMRHMVGRRAVERACRVSGADGGPVAASPT